MGKLLDRFKGKSPTPREPVELVCLTKAEYERIAGYFARIKDKDGNFVYSFEKTRRLINLINSRLMLGD